MTPRNDPVDLTLQHKASLLSGHDFWSTKSLDDAGIPSIVLADGPHGVRLQRDRADHAGIYDSLPSTCLPPAVAVGSSWDVEVASRVGAAVGREARALGVAVVLGPGVNIKRSPLCGRNFEYYSEDPLLTGVLATAHTQALQAQGVGASVKHFAANNQETDRMVISADVDERTLREIYLPAFERIVTEAQPATVMAAYNRVNGVAASQNRWLLTDILRTEWGFTGIVVSDWGGVYDRIAALAAGLDLEMPGSSGVNDAKVAQAVRDGLLAETVVDASVQRLITLAGLGKATEGDLPAERDHHALAREVAADCAVLLRNEHATLPLDPAARIAVIGELAVSPRFQGGGSSRVNPTRIDVPLEAITALGQSVVYARGFTTDGSKDARELRDDAVRIALDADVSIIFAGGDEDSEGIDREHINLPADQIDLIRAVAAVAPRTVVVLSNGGVVSLEGWHDDVDAILEAWFLGQAAGGAIADLLFGVVNPSGHLAETIPRQLQDTPSYLTFPGEQGHVRYGEGVMVGYRYYESVQRAARYPFGHGLSYTKFATSELQVTVDGDDSATVRVTVTNIGDRAGKHVVQVYVATDAGRVRRPARELRAFTKIALQPGESRTVELALDRRSFAYYDIKQARWTVAPGSYSIQIGESATRIIAEQNITLPGDTVTQELSLDSAVSDWLDHPIVGPMFRRTLDKASPDRRSLLTDQASRAIEMVASMPLRQIMQFPTVDLPVDALTHMMELTR
ncbi:glycoside hydrolase family 3 domain protein [Parafrankia sp. EAN1pec]|uniref:glycoside hydrolase family 3 C-terminal domain-containing protein n=1 Tax=Parafrankia sp. (strain EAN1pec) TaxID=298653 RepID=UPI0000540511|nr:glycoside hydrolase family 3 domain protein [Frankia sp. EAN1pec]